MDTMLLRSRLIEAARERQTTTDPSHDINHVLRVMYLAEEIAGSVNADLEVVLPAACFHDIVVYPKNDPQNKAEADESAVLAGEILKTFGDYPAEKIEKVQAAIRQCSYSRGIVPDTIESKVLQDADRLEATGAISVMRTFSSCGQMNRSFYRPEDPFCEKGAVPHGGGLDLFYRRLLLVERGMHTEYARTIARRRTEFLHVFLDELKKELKESGVTHTEDSPRQDQ
jgi:uncharacterized protein